MLRWNIKKICLAASVLLFLALAPPARAQETMTEIDPLSFGLFALRDNNAAHDLIIDAATGNVSADPEFVISTPAQRGEYLLEGFAPGTDVFVTVDDGGLTLGGGGGTQVFATIDYTVFPVPATTNGAGEVTVYVGATLRTNGDATMHPSGNYSDDIDITFDW